MKNPSHAGKLDEQKKKISDDPLYKVLDYLYKQDKNFSKVTVLNLFTVVSGTSENIKKYIESDEEMKYRKKNDEIIKQQLSNNNENEDKIIAAWGSYNDLLESKYNRRIREVLKIIGDKPINIVGSMVEKGKYPGHGKYWNVYG